MSNPKVSIIMGIYNCESTLKESLESIINQTYENWELILCDDCSSDNTYEIAKEIASQYPEKIKLLKNDKNLTLAPTLNKCLEHVTGKYIARQDGDDLSNINRLKEQVRFLESNSDYDLVGSNMISFDEKGEHGIHKIKLNPTKKDYLKNGTIFFHATILMKTEVMKKLGGYCTKWYAIQAEDYELWSRFVLDGYNGINLDRELYYVRENRETYRRKNIKRRLRGLILRFKINMKLKAPIKSYSFIFKDILAICIPKKILIKYYRLNMK